MRLTLGIKDGIAKEIDSQSENGVSDDDLRYVPTAIDSIDCGLVSADNALEEEGLAAAQDADDVFENLFIAEHAETLFENKEARTSNGSHFVLNDGTTKAVFKANAVHYFDKSVGEFKAVDTTFVDNGEELTAKASPFKAKFNKRLSGGRIFDMEKNGCKVALNLNHAAEGCEVKNCECGDKYAAELTLENAVQNTDIQYIVNADRIKENIIVKEKTDNYIYDFNINIQNLTVGVSEDGESVELKSKENGEVQFTIPKPFMFDANHVYSDMVYYEIESVDDSILNLKVIADAEFINADDRAFPVVIDPQIVAGMGSLLATSTEYRNIYSTSSGGPSYSGWMHSGNDCLTVSKNSSVEYRAKITVKRSNLNLDGKKICKAVLKIRPSSIYQAGNCYINNVSTYIYELKDYFIDVTKAMQNNSGNFNIYLESTTNVFNGNFYTTMEDAPSMEIDYITSENHRPVKETFDLGGGAVADFNVSTGEVVAGFSDVTPNDSLMGVGISHVYKKTSENFSCGSNFRLNLHEKFVGSSSGLDANYVYTDSFGDKHGFYEYYYYIKSDGKKQYIVKSNVSVDADGKLTCRLNNITYEVFPEYRSATGLEAMPKLVGVKNIDIFEQRSDEHKQLEQQKEAYKNTLLDYVKASTVSGTTALISFTESQLTKSAYDTFISGVASSNLIILPKAEGLQLRSLLNQKASLNAGNTEVWDDVSIKSIKLQLSDIRFALESRKDALMSFTEVNSSNYSYIKNSLSRYINININGYRFSFLPVNIKTLCYEWNAYLRKYDDQSTDLANQTTLVNNQITAIIGKKTLYLDQIKEYYKEYYNLNIKLVEMEKQLPVNYLSDSSIIKGFNNKGQLVLIFDKYENYVGIEYETVGGKDRIKQLYDNNNKTIKLSYNRSTGLLSSITDTNGKRTSYTYNGTQLVVVNYSSNKQLTLSYNDDNFSAVTSSDKILSYLGYYEGRLRTITQRSQVAAITNDGASGTPDVSSGLISQTNFSYTLSGLKIASVTMSKINTTNLDAKDSHIHYSFDNESNLKAKYVEEGGVVVDAELYEYVPYYIGSLAQTNPHIKVTYADKSSLYSSNINSVSFVAGESETTTLNQFNMAEKVVKSARPLNVGGTNKLTETVDYTYDDNQKPIQILTTLTTDNPAATKKFYTKYFYNDNGLRIRTENYEEGEESVSGINIEETVYDDKGRQLKSFSYNSLDSSSKFYRESVLSEDGKLKAEIDESGEHKTEYEYEEGSGGVRTVKTAQGGKFGYGRDGEGRVTSITQSTAAGESNSVETAYTYGLITELKSGGSVVNYEYDSKRRISAVKLNNRNSVQYNNQSYCTFSLPNAANNNVTTIVDMLKTTVKAACRVNETAATTVTETLTDKRGNLRRISVDGIAQITNTYDVEGKLTKCADGVTASEAAYAYDNAANLITSASRSAGSDVAAVTSSYSYNDYGQAVSKNVGGAVTQAYSYENKLNGGELESTTLPDGSKTVPTRDVNGRNTGKSLTDSSGNNLLAEYVYYRKIGDHATNAVSSIRYGINGKISEGLKYAYDSAGNISEVWDCGKLSVKYTYDSLNRLVREDNKGLNKTFVFCYDNNGNILSKRECTYTIKAESEIDFAVANEKLYSYDESNPDQLFSYDGQDITYNEIGNPLNYRGKELVWAKGRQLSKFGDLNFSYDGSGRRIKKGDIVYTYDAEGVLLKQSNGIEYIYDHSGLTGFIYGGSSYYYRKNVQGGRLYFYLRLRIAIIR